MTTSEKAQDLFECGVGSFEEGNYIEALHYFKESQKVQASDKTEEKIKQCQEKIKEKQQNANTTSDNGNNGDNTQEKSKEEIECDDVITEKDYYKLLGVSKETVTPGELKKVYKRLAIKFHPDKNKSLKAEDAFKKISAAYQTLNDPEKRKVYDKYGTEEEFREKYYQANQQRYEEEEEDAYDIFDILFQNPNGQRRRRTRVRFENSTPEQQRRIKTMGFIQIAFVLLYACYFLIFHFFEAKPLYGFEPSEEFNFKAKTHINKINYFYGIQFSQTFPDKTTIKEEEHNIEVAYLDYASKVCLENHKLEDHIKSILYYTYRDSDNYYKLKNKLKSLDFSICAQYKKLKPLIDNYIENPKTNNKEDDDDDDEDDEEEKEYDAIKKKANTQQNIKNKKLEAEAEEEAEDHDDSNDDDDDDN